jgi:putative RNA 2'-phosphotransferase
MSLKSTSKKLSYILRHNPQSVGVVLDEYGWTDTERLCQKLLIDRSYLEEVVESSTKKDDTAYGSRFRFSEDYTKIKANQGHSGSLNIKNDMEAVNPPFEVFHGTKKSLLDTIMKEGLKPMTGRRKGDNIILVVKTKAMYADNINVYKSENGYFLVDFVDPKYIKLLEE